MTGSERFGANLRDWRQRRDLGQGALGAKVDVDASRISKLESGHENPTLESIDALAAALGIHASLLHAPRPGEEAGRERTSVSDDDGGAWLADYLRQQLERPETQTNPAAWRARVVHAITTLLDALEHAGSSAASGQDPDA